MNLKKAVEILKGLKYTEETIKDKIKNENSEANYEEAKTFYTQMLKKFDSNGEINLDIDRRLNKIWGEVFELPVIASWGITNTMSLNVYEIDYNEDTLKVAFSNDGKKFNAHIKYDTDGEAYITLGVDYYLSECMKAD